jgi:hypothetical protein
MKVKATSLPKTIQQFQICLDVAFAGGKAYGKAKAELKSFVDLTDEQIENIFLNEGWSWNEKADMYVPAVREVLKLFKETNE